MEYGDNRPEPGALTRKRLTGNYAGEHSHERCDDTGDPEIGDDLTITKTTRQAAGAGTWICGRLNGCRFDSLVFPEHAECPNYELGDNRISKLWVQRRADKATVADFDRGWDVEPTTGEVG